MKRKLIAIALACAMVFSMIPSLAFADVTVPDSAVAGVPSGNAVEDLALEVKNFDYKGLTLNNYAALEEKLVAAEDAYLLLEEIKDEANGDYKGDYSEAQEKAAKTEFDRVGAGLVADARTEYEKGIYALVNEELDALVKAYDADFPAKSAAVSAVAAKVPALVEAYLTIDAPDSNKITNYAKFKGYETTLFELEVESQFGSYKANPTATPAGLKASLTKAEQILKVFVEPVVAAYPQLDAPYTGAVYADFYADVVELYNSDFVADFGAASMMTGTYLTNVEKYSAQIEQELKAARDAYNKIIADDYTAIDNGDTHLDILAALHEHEAGYVNALIVDAYTAASGINSNNAADVVAAVEKARAYYDKLAAYYDESGEEDLLDSHSCVALGDLANAELAVKNHYQDVVGAAYLKVQAVDSITDENREDVEAFIAAYDAYVAKLSEGEIANPTSALKQYTAKYEVLKPALEELVAAEDAAAADKELKADVNAAKVKSVKAVSTKKGKIKVTWKKNDLFDGYRIQVAKKSDGKFKKAAVTTKAKKTIKQKSGKTVYVRVQGYAKLSDGSKVYTKDYKLIKVKVK